jgi:thaumarchaeosortase
MESKTTPTITYLRSKWQKYSFHISFMLILTLPIAILMVLDYLNIESFRYFNEQTVPQYNPTRFVFEETWKGRMFYLFFIWIFFIESIIDWEKIIEKKPRNHLRTAGALILAIIPTTYVLTVNFVPNASQYVISLGQQVGIIGDPLTENFLTYHWPLSFEYLIFWLFFAFAIILAYNKIGLSIFSISLSLLGTMTFMYMIDTLYPMGLFTPLQLFALPTAASSAAFLQLLGYRTYLTFPYPYQVGSQYSYLPLLGISGTNSKALVGWPCAGVHSLLLFILIISLFFKRSEISNFRKAIYFVFGLFGTYFVNILRISTILIIGISDQKAATTFHNTYGELYFLTWMLFYILLIFCIQRYMLAEKVRQGSAKLYSSVTAFKNKLEQKIHQSLSNRKRKFKT